MIGLDRRLIVVQGKGGVGRTTVTAALGLAAARAGKRVCIVELSGEAALAHRCGFSHANYEARAVAPNCDLMSLNPTACMVDFGQRKLHIAVMSRLLFESRPMTAFVEAVPGLHDLLQLGKIEDRLNVPLSGETPYDLIVLDGPATGHGLTLLGAARAMRQMTRVGPFADLAHTIERLLGDRQQTATLLVTLPEALPVAEALDLLRALHQQDDVPDAVVVNQVEPRQAPAPPDLPALRDALPPAWQALLDDTLSADARQIDALARLTEGVPGAAGCALPLVRLPRLTPDARGPAALEPLVRALLDVEAA